MPAENNVQSRRVRRKIGVTLVRTDDDRAGFGDDEIGARHSGFGAQDRGRVACRIASVRRPGSSSAGSEPIFSANSAATSPRSLCTAGDDVARILVVELLNTFAEVRFDDLDAHLVHVRAKRHTPLSASTCS